MSLIKRFYESFAALDAEAMAACYHDDISFSDPAFGSLHGDRARNMWRMLCESQKGKNFQIKFSDIYESETGGKAHWEAFYTFSRTGRKVHNIIDAGFAFKDGKIIRHADHFNLYRWSQQAMGLTGYLIGWTGLFQDRLIAQTNKLLDRFEARGMLN